jgi:hypothetical protein
VGAREKEREDVKNMVTCARLEIGERESRVGGRALNCEQAFVKPASFLVLVSHPPVPQKTVYLQKIALSRYPLLFLVEFSPIITR